MFWWITESLRCCPLLEFCMSSSETCSAGTHWCKKSKQQRVSRDCNRPTLSLSKWTGFGDCSRFKYFRIGTESSSNVNQGYIPATMRELITLEITSAWPEMVLWSPRAITVQQMSLAWYSLACLWKSWPPLIELCGLLGHTLKSLAKFFGKKKKRMFLSVWRSINMKKYEGSSLWMNVCNSY